MTTALRTQQRLLAVALTAFVLPPMSEARESPYDCRQSGEINACSSLEYQTRIAQLQIMSGQLVAPVVVGYDCADDDQPPLTAAFYNDTTPASVVLTRGGQDQVIAFSARSGSGARYTADGVEFWEHQGEAAVDWFGRALKCRLVK